MSFLYKRGDVKAWKAAKKKKLQNQKFMKSVTESFC